MTTRVLHTFHRSSAHFWDVRKSLLRLNPLLMSCPVNSKLRLDDQLQDVHSAQVMSAAVTCCYSIHALCPLNQGVCHYLPPCDVDERNSLSRKTWIAYCKAYQFSK